MSDYQKHLYLILFPNEALVASQLTPEEFGQHYSIGSARHFTGKVIFAEVDIGFRHEFFMIDEYLRITESGIPKRPKRTKFVKSYRVLEHIDLAAIGKLYLVTTDGGVLGLDRAESPDDQGKKNKIYLYQEICPLRLLVASVLEPFQFGRYITEETWAKGAPKIFFTQYNIDVEETVASNKVSAFNMGPLPNVNPTNLPTAVKELQEDPRKRTKTVNLNPNLDFVSYKIIRHGFWFSGGKEIIFFRMPGMDELHEKHHSWWRRL
ncbi:MAG TPA: hypothetical protein VLL97_06295 [Acidobacteriota bacterium]|nr:hypothetical protein [Acidobacteriota bacterium]